MVHTYNTIQIGYYFWSQLNTNAHVLSLLSQVSATSTKLGVHLSHELVDLCQVHPQHSVNDHTGENVVHSSTALSAVVFKILSSAASIIEREVGESSYMYLTITNT